MSYEKLNTFVVYCRWMQEQDLDVLCVVSSFKGFGKSSFIIQVARRYVELFGLTCNACSHDWIFTGKALRGKDVVEANIREPCPKCKGVDVKKRIFDFKNFLAYDNEDVKEMIHENPPYSPLLADEGARFMMGEDWMKYESKSMKKLFAQMRTKHMLVFANIPKFTWLDKKYRNDMTTFWVRIIKRGIAVLLHPDLGETDDPWHMKDLQKKLGSYNYFTSESEIMRRIQKLMKHPCAFDYFKIPPVPKEIYQKYLEARDKKAFERNKADDQIDHKTVGKLAAYNLVNRWDELAGAAKMSKKKRPTLKMLEAFVFSNPNTGEGVVKYATLSNWIADIKRLVK